MHVTLSRELGWTLQEIYDTPTDYVEDVLQVINIDNGRKNREMESIKSKNK